MKAIVDLLNTLRQDGAFDFLFELLQRFYHIAWSLRDPDRHLTFHNYVEIVALCAIPDQVIVLVHLF